MRDVDNNTDFEGKNKKKKKKTIMNSKQYVERIFVVELSRNEVLIFVRNEGKKGMKMEVFVVTII